MNAKKPAEKNEKPAQKPAEIPSTGDDAWTDKRAGELAGVAGLFDLFKDGEAIAKFANFVRGSSADELIELIKRAGDLFAIKEPLSSKAGIVARVEATLKLMRVWAKATPGSTDDQVVDTIGVLLNSGLLPVVADLVERMIGGADEPSISSVKGQINGEHTFAISNSETSIRWEEVLPIVISLIKIIRALA